MKYKAAILKLVRQMVLETKHEITNLFKSDLSKEFFMKQKKMAQDASLASRAKILTNYLTEKFSKLFSLKAKPLAQSMLSNTVKLSKSNLHMSLKELSGGLSINTGAVPEGMEDIVKAGIAENVALIESLPQKYFNDITGSVMRSITTGEGVKSLTEDLSKYSEISLNRAKLMALDQTRKAYNTVNKIRMINAGFKKFEWIHSGGGQFPRESHKKINGEIFSFANLEEEQAKLGVPEADRGIPGHPINCFTGSTQVSLANGCANVWRYKHVGKIITFYIGGIRSFTSTINHPILTQRGWLRADEIKEGDYLVSSKFENINRIENKETNNIPTFNEIFDSIEGVRSVELSAKFNFHGDIPEDNVDRIVPAGSLSNRFETTGIQQLENLVFALTNVVRYPSGFSFDPEIFESSCTCRFRQSDPLISSELRHTNDICFTCISEKNTVFAQNTVNNLSASIPIFRQLLAACPATITIANILGEGINHSLLLGCGADIIKSVLKCSCEMIGACTRVIAESAYCHSPIQTFFRVDKKIISEFSGHVYTLESNNGWYNVASTEIISKNCRCTLRPVLDFTE